MTGFSRLVQLPSIFVSVSRSKSSFTAVTIVVLKLSHQGVVQERGNGRVMPEMVNRKTDISLTVHFLYQCHMGFATAPPL